MVFEGKITIKMTEQQTQLPEGWRFRELGKTVDVILGQSPASSTYNFEGDGLPFFQGKTEFTELYPAVKKWCTSPKKIAQKDDVLVSVRAPVGPTNLAPSECAIGRGLAALRVPEEQDKKYYLYLIRRYQNELASLGTGTTFEAISGAVLKGFNVPVAPPKQQKQIVAKIEELFSHIDAGIESLKTAKEKLKQYRQSVLKAAVTGEITKEWRESNSENIEPADQLLKRILKERRQRWEQQKLAEFQAKGKPPKNDKWKEKYKEPEDVVLDFTIPNEWTPTSTDCLCFYVTSGSRGWAKYYSEEGPIFLRMGNLDHYDIELDLKDIQRVQPPENGEGTRTKVSQGDVLISITADVGMVGLIPENFEESYINQHVALARPVFPEIGEYLAWLLSSDFAKDQFKKLQRGATKVGLGLEDIKAVKFGLPSVEEQIEIVRVIEEKLSSADRLMNEIEIKLTQAQQQKQTILASAFKGGLII